MQGFCDLESCNKNFKNTTLSITIETKPKPYTYKNM